MGTARQVASLRIQAKQLCLNRVSLQIAKVRSCIKAKLLPVHTCVAVSRVLSQEETRAEAVHTCAAVSRVLSLENCREEAVRTVAPMSRVLSQNQEEAREEGGQPR
mmetsp:Transcript_100697/g.215841  ORF Transcript_100697/g.215841 Transcript_100697/m.215841 type:complete len:106 (+) Transcript_100697:2-319(+)